MSQPSSHNLYAARRRDAAGASTRRFENAVPNSRKLALDRCCSVALMVIACFVLGPSAARAQLTGLPVPRLQTVAPTTVQP